MVYNYSIFVRLRMLRAISGQIHIRILYEYVCNYLCIDKTILQTYNVRKLKYYSSTLSIKQGTLFCLPGNSIYIRTNSVCTHVVTHLSHAIMYFPIVELTKSHKRNRWTQPRNVYALLYRCANKTNCLSQLRQCKAMQACILATVL